MEPGGWFGSPRVLFDLQRTMLSRCRMIWLLPPLSRQQVVALSQSSCVTPVELTDGRGGEDRGGAKSYDGEKGWCSVKHSRLSGWGTGRKLRKDARDR
jgi:hypothetical protein